MNRCLSEQLLLQCFMGEGGADQLAHLKSCLSCAGRYRALEADMGLITRGLQAPPPRRRHAYAAGFAGWRMALPAAAVLAAFAVGWSLRGASFSATNRPRAQIVSRNSSAPPQLARQPGVRPAMYAEYVQGAFGGDNCSDANDVLEPGCF